MKHPGPYCLANDDDGHWYVIPAALRSCFEEAISGEDPELPEWAEQVGGSPSLVEFTEYKLQ